MKEIRTYNVFNTGAKIPSVGLGTWLAAPGVDYAAISTAVNFLVFNGLEYSIEWEPSQLESFTTWVPLEKGIRVVKDFDDDGSHS